MALQLFRESYTVLLASTVMEAQLGLPLKDVLDIDVTDAGILIEDKLHPLKASPPIFVIYDGISQVCREEKFWTKPSGMVVTFALK